jgi:hypothetical protein
VIEVNEFIHEDPIQPLIFLRKVGQDWEPVDSVSAMFQKRPGYKIVSYQEDQSARGQRIKPKMRGW